MRGGGDLMLGASGQSYTANRFQKCSELCLGGGSSLQKHCMIYEINSIYLFHT